MAEPKRRLPVLQPPPAGDPEKPEAEERPPWHWIGFGTVGIFGAWMPLVFVAQKLAEGAVHARLGPLGSPAEAAAALAALPSGDRLKLGASLFLPHFLALALASLFGGYLVGRHGKGLGSREAAIAGVATALVVGGLTFGAVGIYGLIVPLVVTVPFAALGGHRGRTRNS